MIKTLKRIDKPLLIVTVVLFLFGSIMVFSASNVTAYMSHAVSPYNYFIKQFAFLVVGFILFLFMIRIPTKGYYALSWLLLLGFGASLVVLLLMGQAKNQAISWFDLGIVSIQPSEFIKVIAIVWLAGYYDNNKKKLNTYGKSLFPMIVCGIIAFLIFMQPDLGTTIIFTLIVGLVFLLVPIAKDIKFKTIIAAVGLVVFAGFILISTGKGILLDRQKDRFNFSRPCDSLITSGNQVCNCYIAINNGGLFGVGLGNSTQKYLYLPEPYTDFIYAIIVEELGVVVGILIILAYMFVIYRIMQIGKRATTDRGATMCYAVAFYIFLHIAINLLGIMGLMPMTGVPLPFMSYGGSFTICLIAALTLVQKVNVETAQSTKK